MTRFGRWTLSSLLGIGALVILVWALLFTLLATERGGRWVLDRILPLVAEEASIGSFTGTLMGGIRVEELDLPLDAAHIHITRAEGRWNLWNLLGGQFPVEHLSVTGITITLNQQEREPTPPGPWPSLALPFPVSIDNAEVNDLWLVLGEEVHHIQHIALVANGGVMHTRIDRLAVVMDENRINLVGRIANRAPYALELTADWSALLPDGMQLAGQGKLGGNLAALTLEHSLSAPVELFTTLQVNLPFDPAIATIDPAAATLRLHGRWQDLVPPPGSGLPALSGNGTLDVEGSWADYRFKVDTRIVVSPAENAGEEAPAAQAFPIPPEILNALSTQPLELLLAGTGSELKLHIERLFTDTSLGNLDASGELTLETPLSWDLTIALQDIDSTPVVPEWPAKVSAQLQTSGYWQDGDYQIGVVIADLRGRVLEGAIDGSGSVNLSPGRQHIEQLTVRLGDNQLDINGEIADTLALEWQLAAPNLAQIYPELAGAIQSRGNLAGTLSTPSGNATLQARDVRFGDINVALTDLDLSIPDQDNLSLELSASGVGAGPVQAGTIRARLDGALSQHRLDIDVRDGDNHLAAALTGGIAEQQWQGQIRELELDNPLTGPWRQASASDLVLSVKTIVLDSLCLTQENTSLCANGSWRDQQLAAAGKINNLPLDRYTAALPPELAVAGELNGQFQLSGPLDNLAGDIQLNTDGLALHHQPADGSEEMHYPARLNAGGQLAARGATATLDFSLDGIGNLTASLEAATLASDGQLQGTANGVFDNLDWLDGLLTQIDNLQGRATLAAVISGTLGQPELNGNVAINDFSGEVTVAGIELQQGELTANLDENGLWQLSGQVFSGDGALRLDGNGVISTEQGAGGDISLTGENFTLADRPDMQIRVSPDLRLTLAPDTLQLRGDLKIEDGKLILANLPEQAVSVSADERIVPDEDSEQTGRAVDARIRLTIDDRFQLEGFGLSTRLGGSLQLIQRGEDPPRANGTLTLYDGVYQAYGQNLAVERGVLIFQGQADNPGLNIRAVRKVPGFTVGINIGGVAQDIRSEIFSNPPLPPTDTMAILITGKVPGQMTESDASQVINAAAALGIAQSEGITNNLQNAFGLDVLDLQGGDDYLDSSLVVGKYLTPDLFISYVQNLFTPSGSVQLDYSLTRHLGLKASSGETQSIDLLYRIEHGGRD